MYLIRLLIVGDTGVGKTSLLVRFHENKFIVSQKTTIGVDYKAKEIEIDDEPIKLQIWDTAGQERFRSMTSAFYSKAQGVIATFDVSQLESFYSLTQWITDVRRDAPPECQIIVCANKTDLPAERWAVSRETYELFAKEHDLTVIEASASTGHNVETLFTNVARLVLDNHKPILTEMRDSESRESFMLFDMPEDKRTTKKPGCCS